MAGKPVGEAVSVKYGTEFVMELTHRVKKMGEKNKLKKQAE